VTGFSEVLPPKCCLAFLCLLSVLQVWPVFTLLSMTPANTRIPHFQVCGVLYSSQTCVFEMLDILLSGYFSDNCNLLLFTMGRDMFHSYATFLNILFHIQVSWKEVARVRRMLIK